MRHLIVTNPWVDRLTLSLDGRKQAVLNQKLTRTLQKVWTTYRHYVSTIVYDSQPFFTSKDLQTRPLRGPSSTTPTQYRWINDWARFYAWLLSLPIAQSLRQRNYIPVSTLDFLRDLHTSESTPWYSLAGQHLVGQFLSTLQASFLCSFYKLSHKSLSTLRRPLH